MKKFNMSRIVLLSAIYFISVCAFAQTTTTFNGKSVMSNVVRVKFIDEPTVVNKMDAAYKVNSLNARALKATEGFVSVSGLDKLNSVNESISAIEMTRVFRPAGINEAKHRAFGLHLWYEITYEAGVDIADVIASYSAIESIQVVNPKYETELTGVLPNGANDPSYSDQWHYENTGQNSGTVDADIDLEEAWTLETGNSNVIVAIEDGGIDVDHEDLAGNIWVNSGEIANNGIDDDNNGYIDDVNGYNFADDEGEITALEHGTHVAGTVGAETNNGIGVSGVAGGSGSDDGVRLMSCQVFSDDNSDGFAEAFTYAADNGAVISQNSWGYVYSGVYDQAVLDGIDYFIANAGGSDAAMEGGIVIIAAGNSTSEEDYYPGYYSSALAVSALGNQDEIAYYSNFGTWVDISAPGGAQTTSGGPKGIYSTIPDNSYLYKQGTSMACPHVSGVAALIVSIKYGDITADELWDFLVDNTDDVDALNSSYTGKLGTGRVNAYSSLLAASGEVTIPGAASSPSPSDAATEVSISSELSWTAGSGASSHEVYFGTSSNSLSLVSTQSSTSYDPGTLSASTTYYWSVSGVNSAGTTSGDVWSFTTNDGTTTEYATLPYTTGFEDGDVDEYWDLVTENSYGRLQVTSSNTPNGNYHLTSDVTTSGNYSTNEAWLKLDLSSEDVVDLSFSWKEFGDETDTEDGVFFSDDAGSSFTKVYSLEDGSTTYETIELDVDALASANGLSLTETFVIKFQQRDNYAISTDGFAYDDISVTSGSNDGGSSDGTYTVDLSIVLDNYPEETSWDITNASGTVVESGGTYGSESDGATVTVSVTLEEACYDLTIYDSYGDGICCSHGSGSYELVQGSTTLASGASFSSSETTSFCVVASSDVSMAQTSALTEVKEDLSINIYPNPASSFVVIASENDGDYVLRDMTGKTLMSGKLAGATTTVDLNAIASGIYMIDVTVDNEVETLKVLKNK